MGTAEPVDGSRVSNSFGGTRVVNDKEGQQPARGREERRLPRLVLWESTDRRPSPWFSKTTDDLRVKIRASALLGGVILVRTSELLEHKLVYESALPGGDLHSLRNVGRARMVGLDLGTHAREGILEPHPSKECVYVGANEYPRDGVPPRIRQLIEARLDVLNGVQWDTGRLAAPYKQGRPALYREQLRAIANSILREGEYVPPSAMLAFIEDEGAPIWNRGEVYKKAKDWATQIDQSVQRRFLARIREGLIETSQVALAQAAEAEALSWLNPTSWVSGGGSVGEARTTLRHAIVRGIHALAEHLKVDEERTRLAGWLSSEFPPERFAERLDEIGPSEQADFHRFFFDPSRNLGEGNCSLIEAIAKTSPHKPISGFVKARLRECDDLVKRRATVMSVALCLLGYGLSIALLPASLIAGVLGATAVTAGTVYYTIRTGKARFLGAFRRR